MVRVLELEPERCVSSLGMERVVRRNLVLVCWVPETGTGWERGRIDGRCCN
jgi:hypothetical protein